LRHFKGHLSSRLTDDDDDDEFEVPMK